LHREVKVRLRYTYSVALLFLFLWFSSMCFMLENVKSKFSESLPSNILVSGYMET